MTTPPFYPKYPKSWRADPFVERMSLEMEGAYARICDLMWIFDGTCSLPDDDEIVAELLRVTVRKWRKLKSDLVDGKFAVIQRVGSRLTNVKLRKEWEKAVSAMRGSAEKGRVGAKKRWDSEKSAEKFAKSPRNDWGGQLNLLANQDGPPMGLEVREDQHLEEKREERISLPKVVEFWNEAASRSQSREDGLPGLITAEPLDDSGDDRTSLIAERLLPEGRDEAWWKDYFTRIADSDFCRGKRGWRADLAFAIASEQNVRRVLAGKYANERGPPGSMVSSEEALDRLPEGVIDMKRYAGG